MLYTHLLLLLLLGLFLILYLLNLLLVILFLWSLLLQHSTDVKFNPSNAWMEKDPVSII